MQQPAEPKTSNRSTVWRILLPVFLLAVVVALPLAASLNNKPKVPKYTTVPVEERYFTRAVDAVGNVSTYRPHKVYNNCRAWGRRIISLLPEGTWVKKGDVVCVLDASEFRNQLPKPTKAVIADDARLASAEKDVIIQSLQNGRRIEEKQREATKAKNSLDKYVGAEEPNQIKQLQGDIRMREAEFEQSKDEFEHSRRLKGLGVVNSRNLNVVSSRLKRHNREVDLAKGELNLKQRYDGPRTLKQLLQSAGDTVREIDRTELRNDLALSMANFWILSFTKYRAGWQQYVDYLTRSIEACEMRAPKDGQILYPETEKPEHRVEVGKYVHYQQHMFSVINRSRLTIDGKISDRMFYSLRKGQRVKIRVTALPGKVFFGELKWLATYSEPTDKFTPHIRFHRIQVLLDDEATDHLYPGMTADMKIITDLRKSVIQVPMEAVFEHHGHWVVLVKTDSGRLERRAVDVGKCNEKRIEIRDGLEPGEKVVIDDSEAQRALAESLL